VSRVRLIEALAWKRAETGWSKNLQAFAAQVSRVRLTEALAWKRGETSWPKNLQAMRASRTVPKATGGQGVHREVESEGHEEKYRAAIEGEIP